MFSQTQSPYPHFSWRITIGIVFFLSGAVSLVYEVVWARLLSYQLGNTSQAHTVVVAAFMGGMGLGYWVGGKLADTMPRPLRFYVAVELAISAWALLSPSIIGATSNSDIAPIATATMALGPPTFMMGMTLPLLAKGLLDRGLPPRDALPSLYAVNSLGAVIGILAAGTVMVEQFGLQITLRGAVVVNIALAGCAWLLARAPLGTPLSPACAPAHPTHEPLSSPLLVVLGAWWGFIALGLQGVWLRVFGLVLGSSSYAFTLVIAVFIGGVALGSAAARRWSGHHSTTAIVALSLLMFASLLLMDPLYERLPYLLGVLKHDALSTSGPGVEGFVHYSLYRLGLVGAFVLVPTAISGAALPILAAMAASKSEHMATAAGRIFAANTLGSVAGVVVTVPLLIGVFGLGETYRFFTVAAALALAVTTLSHPKMSVELRTGLVTITATLCLVVPSGWNAQLLSVGSFRSKQASSDYQTHVDTALRGKLVFHEDGPNATVTVVERGKHRTLTVNGKPDASTRGDMLTQVGSAHLPLLLHPNPSSILVVGLGSGVTVGSASLHDVQVDVVELSPAVVNASKAFNDVNGQPLERNNVRLIVDDARSYLNNLPVGHRFDVIVSEPSNPWVAGNAGLFGFEFFQTVSDHLSDEGVFAQWIHLYETDDASVALVLRTMTAVFQQVSVWEMFPNDVLLIARRGARSRDFPDWKRRVTPAIAQDLARVHLNGPHLLTSLRAMRAEAVATFTNTAGPLNRDDHPLLEFAAPRSLFAGARATLLDRFDERRHAPQTLSPQQNESLFVLHTIFPGAPSAFRLSLINPLIASSSIPFLVDVLFTLEREKRYEVADTVANHLEKHAPGVARAHYAIARLRLAQGDPARARTHLDRCLTLGDEPRQRCGPMRHRLDR